MREMPDDLDELAAGIVDLDLLPAPRSWLSRGLRRRWVPRRSVGMCGGCRTRWDSSYAAAMAAQHARETGHVAYVEAAAQWTFAREADGVA